MIPAESPPSLNASEAALSPRDLRGVFLPIPTPFDSAGEIDLPALRANMARWNDTGISGYVLLGSTGERVHLNEREYLEVIAAARAALDQRADLKFIVGAGQQSTRGTIDEIKKVAAAVKLDAFLVITPHFYRPSITQQALLTHYQAVADESPTPLILYSMPALTGIKIDPETAARLSEHQNIIGIKDSSADLEGLKATISLVGSDFTVLTGNGTVLWEALIAGATGGILAVACVAPDVCLAIARAVAAGDNVTAENLQNKLTPLAKAVTVDFGIGGLKAALEMKGYCGGEVRAPLRAPDRQAREEISRCLHDAETALRESSVRFTEPGAVAPRP
ncbi:MAG TPA: dihydrodipicolinate synthase family protein [Pyrinomonadaceae bacterium]|nr:dihydrodipicolinate synthase family protein [Pyrinomonadaceae bacterium]